MKPKQTHRTNEQEKEETFIALIALKVLFSLLSSLMWARCPNHLGQFKFFQFTFTHLFISHQKNSFLLLLFIECVMEACIYVCVGKSCVCVCLYYSCIWSIFQLLGFRPWSSFKMERDMRSIFAPPAFIIRTEMPTGPHKKQRRRH